MAYADVSKLTAGDVVKGIDGNLWIKIKRTKPKSLSSIPLLPVAQHLIKKYKNRENPEGTLLPVYTTQRMNSYLREIADQ